MVVEANFLERSKKLRNKKDTMDFMFESTDWAFRLFEQHFLSLIAPMDKDMQLVPVIISIIAHDWIKAKFDLDTIDYKSSFFLHKIQEEEEYIDHMRML